VVGWADCSARRRGEVREVAAERLPDARAWVGLAEVTVAVEGQQHRVASRRSASWALARGVVGSNLVPMSRIGFGVVAFHGPV
jgi:hypothetical protein